MRLYKFICERYAVETLLQQRLKISKSQETNDPFEYCPFRFQTEADRLLFKKILHESDKEFGFISFSSRFDSPSMWANYADNHAGICLGFDVQNELFTTIAPTNDLCSIEYVDECIDFDVDSFNNRDETAMLEACDFALRTKSSHWRYENEYRLFTRPNEIEPETSITFRKFDSRLILREIILGFRSRLSKKTFENLPQAGEYTFYRTQPSLTEFRMDRLTLES